MPFYDTLAFMLDMCKTTLQTRLNILFEYKKKGRPMSQQAFSKLRTNFNHTHFAAIHNYLVNAEIQASAVERLLSFKSGQLVSATAETRRAECRVETMSGAISPIKSNRSFPRASPT